MSIKFKQPSTLYARLNLVSIAAQLDERPGEWAIIDKGDEVRMRGKAGQYRRRAPVAFRHGAYEFTVRVTKKGESKARLYARRLA